MVASIGAVGHWIASGLREAASMLWLTWWPLVLGFSLSGIVQSAVARDGLRARLGETNAVTVTTASLLGVISSSCSYAASAMGRALFARGASWTNSIIFMVASTNLVIELGIVLYLLLGWQFVVAQFVGGAIMIALLSFSAHLVFSRRYERGSTIVTSNLPFDEWTGVFASERLTGALLDRLTHHVHILEMNGDSFRLAQSKRRTRRARSEPPADGAPQE